ncbi:MAG: hypothetical protein J5779_02855, partial [Clostridia bacterium]|nr:hypothetical protein [Clostridia bacterium]
DSKSGKKDKKGKGNDNDSKKKNGNGKEDTNKKKKKPFQNIIPKVFEIEAEKTVQPKVATESQVEKKEKAPSKGAEENIEEEEKNLNALLQNNFNLMNSYINKAKGELDKEVSNKVSEKTDVLNKGNFAMEVVNNQIDAVVAGIEQTEEVEEVLSQKTDKLEKRSENVLNL